MPSACFSLCWLIVSMPQIFTLSIGCITNVTFVSSDFSSFRNSSNLTDCFCWISRENFIGANFFSTNNTCQLFANFTTNYQFNANTNVQFCFTSEPPIQTTSIVTSSTVASTTTGLLRWNSTGVTVATGAGSTSVLNPYSVFVDNRNYIYITHNGNDRVSKWPPNPTGSLSFPILQTDSRELNSPMNLYTDIRNGMIYVSDQGNGRVRSFANGSTTGQNVTSTTVGRSPKVDGIYLDPNGTIFVTDSTNHRIYNWFTNATAAGGSGAGAGANQFNGPRRFFIDDDFSFYITDYGNHRVQKWVHGAATGVTVAGGNGGGSRTDQLLNPVSVAVSSLGDVIVCDYGNHRIQRWRPSATVGETIAGSPTGVSGSTAALLNYPRGVALDQRGNIYVADSGNSRIQRFDLL